MNSDPVEVRGLLEVLSRFITRREVEEMTAKQRSMALTGLRHMDPQCTQVARLLSVLEN